MSDAKLRMRRPAHTSSVSAIATSKMTSAERNLWDPPLEPRPPSFQGTVKIGLRCGNGRNQTKSEAGQNRDNEREAERTAVHGDLGEARHALRHERQQKIHAPERQNQTHRASERGEQQALRQKLAKEPSAARAHRDAGRDFALANPRRAPA